MASFGTACRLSARLTSRQLRPDVAARGFRSSATSLAAQNFTMPALSPTMTEGNIARWNLKEGDAFAAGDILLEIETDKASMDVEAQDDGVLAKIILGDGSKSIQVGTRIGVLAEPGDDLSSLEIPPEDSAAAVKKESKPAAQPEAAKAEAPKASTSAEGGGAAVKKSGPAKKQTYPLLPSVQHLIHEHGLDQAAIDKMTPSGPNNRLLKGDVLAYLGSISSSYPTELSGKIAKLSHLDLSNIKAAAPKPKPAEAAKTEVPELAVEEEFEVAVPISMKAVLEVQKRIQSTLGVFLPMSTFISRAADVANDDLPRPKNYQPSADELFNQVLGLDAITTSSGTRGAFIPQITAFPPTVPTLQAKPTKRPDIIDILSSSNAAAPRQLPRPAPGLSSSVNIFSLTVPKDDEHRAQVFLDRVKLVLESEPGRLVL